MLVLLAAARPAIAESRLPSVVEDRPGSLVTVTAEQIAASGATTLEEFLARLPYFTGGGLGRFDVDDGAGRAVLAVRGLSPLRTLVLVNGKRRVGTRSVVDLNAIPLASVSRVEILLRSSQARAGVEAISGVVNVITRISPGGQASVFAGVTSAGDGEQLATSVGLGDERWSVSAQYLLRGELDPNAVQWRSGRLETFAAVAQGELPLTENSRLYLESHLNQRGSRQRQQTASVDGERRFNVQDASLFQLIAGVAGELQDWSLDLHFGGGQSNIALETRTPSEDEIVLARESDTQFYIGGEVNGPLFLAPGGPATMDLGFLFRDERWVERGERGTATGGFDAFEVFGEVTAPLLDSSRELEISLAGRLSDFSSVGDVFAFEGRLFHRPLEGVTVHAGYGRGQRAPSANELFALRAERLVDSCLAPPCPASQGSRALAAETNTFVEGGVEFARASDWGELSLSTDVYSRQIDEAISSDPLSGVLRNSGALRSAGLDLRGQFHFEFPANSTVRSLDLGGQMDYLLRLEQTGSGRLDRTFVLEGAAFPRFRGLVSASLELGEPFGARTGAFRLDQRWRYVGGGIEAERRDGGGIRVPSAAYWDVSVSYRVGGARLAVGADNVLNGGSPALVAEGALRPSTYDLVGRYLYLRVTYAW